METKQVYDFSSGIMVAETSIPRIEPSNLKDVTNPDNYDRIDLFLNICRIVDTVLEIEQDAHKAISEFKESGSTLNQLEAEGFLRAILLVKSEFSSSNEFIAELLKIRETEYVK